jgi:hypothetical protein
MEPCYVDDFTKSLKREGVEKFPEDVQKCKLKECVDDRKQKIAPRPSAD